MAYANPHGPSCPWYNIAESNGAPNIKWCEETLCQVISEPANTWSNVGYWIAALFISYLAYKHKHNSNLKQFGPIVFLIGSMSFFYHLSNFYGSQVLDFIGMFFFGGWAVGMNLIRLGKMKSNHLIGFNLLQTAILVAIMHALYLAGIQFQVLILATGFIILATEMMARKIVKVNYHWFIATLAFMIVALGFSVSDVTGTWCNPTHHGWFSQGHAMWHWVAALGLFTIYKHYSQAALKPQE